MIGYRLVRRSCIAFALKMTKKLFLTQTKISKTANRICFKNILYSELVSSEVELNEHTYKSTFVVGIIPKHRRQILVIDKTNNIDE